jgi:hypothetical protein
LWWTALQFKRLIEVHGDGWIIQSLSSHLPGAQLVATIHEARAERDPVQPLSVLLRYRASKASDDRDRVYGLLSLQPKGFRELGLQISYEISSHTLYHNVAIAILETDQNLNILSIPRVKSDLLSSTGATLPSWAPDWSQHPTIKTLLELEASSMRKPYAFGNDEDWKPRFSNDRFLLGIEGFCVDSIDRAVFVEPPQARTRNSKLSWLRDLFDRANRLKSRESMFRKIDQILQATSSRPYFGGHSMMLVAWETLSCGIHDTNLDEAYAQQRQEDEFTGRLYFLSHMLPLHFMVLCLWKLWSLLTFPFPNAQPRHKVRGESSFSAYDRSVGRTVFRTRDGYVGIGPPDAVPGDPIILAKGSMMPLILRPTGDRWQLLGDCFVAGLMQGQRWNALRCEVMWIQ